MAGLLRTENRTQTEPFRLESEHLRGNANGNIELPQVSTELKPNVATERAAEGAYQAEMGLLWHR